MRFLNFSKSVLLVAPSRRTRGGITAVVMMYEATDFWRRNNCYWIETHLDKGLLWKIIYFIKSLFIFLGRILFCHLVHVHVSEPVSAIRKSFFICIALLFKKPIILHFHAFSLETTINSHWKPIYNFIFHKSSTILVLSESWKKAVHSSLGNDLFIHVLPNPCRTIPYQSLNPERSRPYILFAGTLNRRKGYADLILAFSGIANQFPEWDLVLAGNGELVDAKALADRLGLGGRLRLPGWVSGNNKNALFQHAGIFCLPSYAEGFPMAILDAFSHGLPVVTSKVGGIPDILEDEISALLILPGDISALANALRKLLASQNLRVSLSCQSRLLASTVFSLENVVSNLEEIYSDTALLHVTNR